MAILGLLLTVFQLASPLSAGNRSAKLGIVWSAPESPILAVAELDRIRASGVTHVRTGSVLDQAVYDRADSLGMVLFRELPMVNYPARVLVDSTLHARGLLRQILFDGKNHPSAGPIGLAVNSDVSDPEACAYFQNVHSGDTPSSSQQYYYVSSYVEADVCRHTVDFVLLDVLDDPEPFSWLSRWAAVQSGPAGLASVGRWVTPDSRRGLGSDHSPEEQARFLETVIKNLAGVDSSAFVFVHRWMDQIGTPGNSAVRNDLYGRRYGLHDTDRNARVAASVLSSYLNSGQDVFAFEPARARQSGLPWFILLGWVLIIVVAVLYASSPRFRYMLPRYFMAHGFFRNAVREAREVLPIVSTALLTITGIAIGMVGTQVFLGLHDTKSFKYLVSIQSSQLQSVINAMLVVPLLSVILLGSIALLTIAVWMGLWMIIASRKAPLLPSQALMLGVWPRWQLLLLLPMVMSIHTLPPESALTWIGILIPLWIGTALWASVRTAYDLFKITNCGPIPAVAVWLLNPVWLSLVLVVIAAIVYIDHTAFLWHLMLKS